LIFSGGIQILFLGKNIVLVCLRLVERSKSFGMEHIWFCARPAEVSKANRIICRETLHGTQNAYYLQCWALFSLGIIFVNVYLYSSRYIVASDLNNYTRQNNT